MDVVFHDDDGTVLDASGEIDSTGIVLNSRGGARGAANARNTAYATALRLILGRLARADVELTEIFVDSTRVQHLPMDERRVLTASELRRDPAGAFSLLSGRMGRVGSRRVVGGGNRNKRLRFAVLGRVEPLRMARVVGATEAGAAPAAARRLSADILTKVEADHIWHAIRDLTAGMDHPFGESSTYDLITDDGVRLPPKAVFGLAATRALGFKVEPHHFSAGWGQPCFRILLAAGYRIEAKQEDGNFDPDPRIWVEGERRLAVHMRRERGRGLAQAKKVDYGRRHGRLVCERCGFDPVTVYGSEAGEACIEVHHAATEVRLMADGHETRLEDLICLCANCHRYVHRLSASSVG
ncbi:HNH endonuclease [Sphingomonas sp. Leaf343]|uniref:HNH endonuclease n=1 Tax=Sphingomonas sp. Leaf343 TaxID=1736345 RepID=UPI0007008168|nr:HNH endonuclease [Sphingomonas sp. Leaf343]KQR80538.1 hypothetical protein ASG07_15475 [Sphingomonas sp. Leaf343]